MMLSRAHEEILEGNLKALCQRNPSLALRICAAMAGDHIELLAAGSRDVTARLRSHGGIYLHSADDPVAEGDSAVREFVWGKDKCLLCVGVGLGYHLPFLLRKCNGRQTVFAYERDPWLLRLTLMLTDFSRDILAWRLQFLLGTDISTLQSAETPSLCLWKHPVLGPLYQEELGFLNCPVHSFPQERAMVAAGGLFVGDVVDALREERYQTMVWDPRRVSREESIHQIRQYAPKTVFAVNYHHGLPELCESLGVPLVIWEVDPSIERLPPKAHSFPHCYIYTYRKTHLSRFRQAGFQNIEYLPLGTNPKIRHPTTLPLDDRKKYGADIAFVGSSMAEQSRKLFKIFVDIAAKRGFQPDPGFIGKRILDLQSSLSDKDTIDQVLHEYLQLDDESSCVLPDSDGRLVDLASCVGEAAASQRRLQITSDLAARGFDVAVWGDNGWTTAVSSGVRYRGPANHGHELTCIYNAAKIHLDIDRLYQNDIVTMRVFDILACKGFVLAALSSDLVELFRLDLEVIAYRSMEELAKLAQHFLQNDEDRRQIANAGYERVLKDHTILQRVRSILQHLP